MSVKMNYYVQGREKERVVQVPAVMVSLNERTLSIYFRVRYEATVVFSFLKIVSFNPFDDTGKEK